MAPDEEFRVTFPTLFVALDWVEAHCVIPDGFRKGEPFDLLDWQFWCLANAYRLKPDVVWNPKDPVLAPAFYYRRSQIVLPQKAGKGPYSAARICLEGLGPALFAGWARGGEVYDCREYGCGCGFVYVYEPGEAMGMPWPTPLIQVTAFSEEQAGNVYDAFVSMVKNGPLQDLIPSTPGEEFTRLPGGGRVDKVTSNAQSRLGQRVTYVPQDETGIWTTTNKMTKVATTQRRGLAGMGGRAEETTNAWDPSEQSVAQMTAESRAKDVFRFHPQAPATLSYTNKAERRRIHRYVYRYSLRENGGHIDLDSIEAEAAELLEKSPAEAERFFGNRIVSGSGSWVERAKWEKRKAPTPREIRRGSLVVLGFDGSDVDDWTAIRAETADGYQFTPTYGPDNLPTIWNPADHGGQVPRLEVDAAVDELFAKYEVVRMYCDPPYWESEVDAWAERHGEKRVIRWHTRRPVQMFEAAERLRTDIVKADSGFTHDGCELTAQHVANARCSARPQGRYVLVKATDPQKIDACVTSVITHEAAGDVTAAKGWRSARSNYVYLPSTTRRR
ncbi:hypothetical protein [Prauserella muralis]|uniref:Uncharacterized protein n=1 Tax=Prauserella muralis TaxID=588067 RepID=A0A2V4AMN7_9PSEU|nr:hypothetical protein [Prauserella muralis]PXY20889.1 hypothetical protein BAY60_25635 [Prauserella muralis]TWE29930.1 hypothetical protein FHX69_2623 [Prauserella muralis]